MYGFNLLDKSIPKIKGVHLIFCKKIITYYRLRYNYLNLFQHKYSSVKYMLNLKFFFDFTISKKAQHCLMLGDANIATVLKII